jgi:hypothetical protein
VKNVREGRAMVQHLLLHINKPVHASKRRRCSSFDFPRLSWSEPLSATKRSPPLSLPRYPRFLLASTSASRIARESSTIYPHLRTLQPTMSEFKNQFAEVEKHNSAESLWVIVKVRMEPLVLCTFSSPRLYRRDKLMTLQT